MSVLPVVQKLLALASDPKSRSAVESDSTVMAGLGKFLENDDAEVVRTALETMNYLADCPKASVFADSVKKQMIYGSGPNKSLAQKVFVKMQTHGTQAAGRADMKNKPLGEITNTQSLRQGKAVAARVPVTFTTHTFYLRPNVQDEDVDDVEMRLLQVPGVVSFTLDRANRSVTVRTSESDARVFMRRLQEQYSIPIEFEKAAKSTPDYLDDENQANNNDAATGGWGSWLVSFGGNTQKKPTQREKNAPSSWTPWASSIKSVGQGLGVL